MAAKHQSLYLSSKWGVSMKKMTRTHLLSSTIRASQSADDKDKVFKQLGMFALRRKIEDAVVRGKMLVPTVHELEDEMRVWREEKMRDYNFWDDPVKSNEMLVKLADRAEVVDTLKDLAYKIEEANLIKELAGSDAVNYGLFKQAYNASVDISKFLDRYEMSKLLNGPYDMHGASLVIKAGNKGIYSEVWVERLLNMYIKWAEKQGHKGRVLEKCSSNSGGVKSVTIEFEFKYAYGFLSGERGIHHMISSLDESSCQEVSLASVDVIPLFLEVVPDIPLDDKDLVISYFSSENDIGPTVPVVHIRHPPTGICVQSSGERSKFANKIKALNRLKAKLLVVMLEQGTSSLSSIERDSIIDVWKQDTRRYMLQPYKLVEDLKTGVQLPDLNSVLNGNINLLIAAHVHFAELDDNLPIGKGDFETLLHRITEVLDNRYEETLFDVGSSALGKWFKVSCYYFIPSLLLCNMSRSDIRVQSYSLPKLFIIIIEYMGQPSDQIVWSGRLTQYFL